MKTFRKVGSIAVSSIALNLISLTQVQAANLVSNGNFAGATFNSGAVTDSVYLGDSNVTLPGWSFPTNVHYGSESGYNFLVPYGSTVYSGSANGGLARLNPTVAPFSGGTQGVFGLDGSGTVLNPVTNSSSGFFIAADAFFKRGPLQTPVNLTAGNSYTLSFYQATGQQTGGGGKGPQNFTDRFDVSIGGVLLSNQPSDTMSYTAGSNITPWQLVTKTFTANTTGSQVLSFLAQSQVDAPPFALLADVSLVDTTNAGGSTPVPEPENYIGTLIGLGFVATVVKSRLTKKKLEDN